MFNRLSPPGAPVSSFSQIWGHIGCFYQPRKVLRGSNSRKGTWEPGSVGGKSGRTLVQLELTNAEMGKCELMWQQCSDLMVTAGTLAHLWLCPPSWGLPPQLAHGAGRSALPAEARSSPTGLSPLQGCLGSGGQRSEWPGPGPALSPRGQPAWSPWSASEGGRPEGEGSEWAPGGWTDALAPDQRRRVTWDHVSARSLPRSRMWSGAACRRHLPGSRVCKLSAPSLPLLPEVGLWTQMFRPHFCLKEEMGMRIPLRQARGCRDRMPPPAGSTSLAAAAPTPSWGCMPAAPILTWREGPGGWPVLGEEAGGSQGSSSPDSVHPPGSPLPSV